MAAQFELTKNEQGEHHFVLRAPNGDPICPVDPIRPGTQ